MAERKITDEEIAICEDNRAMPVGTEIYCPATKEWVIKTKPSQYCAPGEGLRAFRRRFLNYTQKFLTPEFSVESYQWPATESGIKR